MTVSRVRPLPRALTVTQLTTLVRDALEREVGRVLVAGEISNLKLAASGHAYFTLKDERSQIRCVMFRSAMRDVPFEPADGQAVIARGQVNLYPQRGDLQLYVDALEPQGVGALQLAFEQLKARLAAEGLFEDGRKRMLPFFPRHVGVATALGGAALHDILVILQQRCPALHVVVRPVRVQGIGAADDIVAGIADLNAHPEVEVLIVGRGGGSLEDLWPFNEERVARAIAASRLPVVSAVGHEIDFTIADFVADRRAPTPTAAAELVVPRAADLAAVVARTARALAAALVQRAAKERRHVDHLQRRLRDPRRSLQATRMAAAALEVRLHGVLGRRLATLGATIERAERRLALRHPGHAAAAATRVVAAAERRLTLATRHRVARARARLGAAAAALDGLSPLGVLQRGYSLTRRLPDGTIVRDAGVLAAGDRVAITFAAGTVEARVEETDPPAPVPPASLSIRRRFE